jgi:hypothetical protein
MSWQCTHINIFLYFRGILGFETWVDLRGIQDFFWGGGGILLSPPQKKYPCYLLPDNFTCNGLINSNEIISINDQQSNQKVIPITKLS